VGRLWIHAGAGHRHEVSGTAPGSHLPRRSSTRSGPPRPSRPRARRSGKRSPTSWATAASAWPT
jgi:hypothetical protein